MNKGQLFKVKSINILDCYYGYTRLNNKVIRCVDMHTYLDGTYYGIWTYRYGKIEHSFYSVVIELIEEA